MIIFTKVKEGLDYTVDIWCHVVKMNLRLCNEYHLYMSWLKYTKLLG